MNSQILSQTVTHTGLKIVEYGSSQSKPRKNGLQSLRNNPNLLKIHGSEKDEESDLIPDFVKTDKDSLKQTHSNFLNKFEEISSKIADSKSGDDYDRQRITSDVKYGVSQILNNYQAKIDRQNARIISDKNKFEVNCELREFEIAERQQNLRKLVKIQDDDS